MMHSITVLVVICACSLVLATPTVVVAAIGNAAKLGVLVKHGLALCKAQVEQPGRCASSILVRFDAMRCFENSAPLLTSLTACTPAGRELGTCPLRPVRR